MPKSPGIPNPHDSLFRKILSDPDSAQALMQTCLPKEVVGLFSNAPPELQNTSFVLDDLRNRQCDLLFKMPLVNDEELWLYLLIEHKSGTAPYLLLQLAAYHLAIANHFRRVRKGKPIVPWVLPVVIVNSQEKLAAPVAFTEMIKAPSTIRAASMEGKGWLVAPGQKYILVALNKVDFSAIADNAAVVGLEAMRIALLRKKIETVFEALTGIDIEARTEIMLPVLTYLAETHNIEFEEIRRLLHKYNLTKWEEEMPTLAETLRDEGRVEGLQEGLQKGRQEGLEKGETQGRLKGLTETLIDLLQNRFGPLSSEDRKRINQASEIQIKMWFNAILNASQLSDIFGKRPKN